MGTRCRVPGFTHFFIHLSPCLCPLPSSLERPWEGENTGVRECETTGVREYQGTGGPECGITNVLQIFISQFLFLFLVPLFLCSLFSELLYPFKQILI